MGWLQRFMYGRRGGDQLSLALMAVGILLTLVSSIVSWFAIKTTAYVVYVILQVISTAVFVLAVWRMFSRNIPARERENQKFLGVWRRFTGWFKRDRKNFVYLKCADCKASLRVPKGKGTMIVTCPKCGKEMKIRT